MVQPPFRLYICFSHLFKWERERYFVAYDVLVLEVISNCVCFECCLKQMPPRVTDRIFNHEIGIDNGFPSRPLTFFRHLHYTIVDTFFTARKERNAYKLSLIFDWRKNLLLISALPSPPLLHIHHGLSTNIRLQYDQICGFFRVHFNSTIFWPKPSPKYVKEKMLLFWKQSPFFHKNEFKQKNTTKY